MKKKYKIIISIVMGLLLIYFILTFAVVKEVIFVIMLSFAIAYTLKPLQRKLINRGLSKTTSAVMLLIGSILIFLAIVIIFIPSMFSESSDITPTINEIRNFVKGFYLKLKPLHDNPLASRIIKDFSNRVNDILLNIAGRLFNGLISIGEDFLTLLVLPIIIYYFLSDSEVILNRLMVFLPSKSRNMAKKILKDIDKVLSSYIVSQLLLCTIVGILTFIILLFYHIKFPLILSFLNALFNIIPYFGPLFGAIPAIIMALLKSPYAAIWVSIWLWLLQQIEGNVIAPRITGDSIDMHPLVVIILLIVGGEIGGFWGMVLAIPVGVVAKVIYEDLNYYLF